MNTGLTRTTAVGAALLVATVASCTSREATVRPDNAPLGAGGVGAAGAGAGAGGDAQAGSGGAGAAGTGAGSGSGGAAGASGGGGAAGGGGAKPPPTSCKQGRPGPEMVLIPKPGGAFCIDKTEVQRKHYAEFLKAVGEKPAKDGPECADNLSYRPVAGDHACPDSLPAENPPFPDAAVNCIDWCDARAFCRWAGKRLCTSSPAGVTSGDPSAAGEWNLACSNGAKTRFPYGDAYEPGRCHDNKGGLPDKGATAFEPGLAKDCRGAEAPYDQLLDMSGGEHELTNGCWEKGAETFCLAFGGGLGDGASQILDTSDRLGCWTPVDLMSVQATGQTGIRCCADD